MHKARWQSSVRDGAFLLSGRAGRTGGVENLCAIPNIWIDTDIGDDIDDAVALWVAARHRGLRLVGVSTV